VEVASVGEGTAVLASGGTPVAVDAIAPVGLGGEVGTTWLEGVSGGVVGLSLGVQPAMAAPAATVAVSFKNIRREIGGRCFIVCLRNEYQGDNCEYIVTSKRNYTQFVIYA
jgi:hypothetical protein